MDKKATDTTELVLVRHKEIIEAGKSLSVGNLDSVRSAFTTMKAQMTLGGTERMGLYRQSLNMLSQAQSTYSSAISNIVSQLSSGTMPSATAMTRFRVAAQQAYKDAFLAGTYRAGNTFYKELGLTGADSRFVHRAAGIEAGFWRNFQRDILNPNYPPHMVARRLEMYQSAINAQYWNGYVAGLPENTIIAWVLGTPKTEHCPDCLSINANSPYPRELLPTVPKAGETACLTRCYCELRELSPQEAIDLGLIPPGVGMTRDEVYGLKPCTVIGAGGSPVPAGLAETFYDMFNEINRLRQLIELDIENIDHYIQARRALVREVRILSETHGVRVIPKYSVKELVQTVRSVVDAGWQLSQTVEGFSTGEMLYEVRNTFINSGLVVSVEAGVLTVETAHGVIEIHPARTLVFFRERT